MAHRRGICVAPVRWTALGSVLFLLTALFQVPAHAQWVAFSDRVTDEPVRILPVGDSITHGTAGDWTWRYFLDRHLRAVGESFDLVGPQREVYDLAGRGWDQVYADPDFDQDHAAWWGNSMAWRLDPGPSVLVADHAPDVVVIALGANDVGFWNRTPEQTLGLAERWMEAARSVDPGLGFVLVDVPLTHRDVFEPYNRLLAPFAAESSTPQSPVVVAAAAAGYRSSAGLSDGGDTWDQQHPNAQGAQKIAAAVADALAELGIGEPHVRPLPEVHDGPTEIPLLTSSPAPGSDGSALDLAWTAVAGASAVQLEHRTDESEWRAAGQKIDTNDRLGTRLESLEECVTHEIRARSVKVWTIASQKYASVPVRHRWGGEVVDPPVVSAEVGDGEVVLTWPPVPHACSMTVEVRRTKAGQSASVLREVVDGDRYVLTAPPTGDQVDVRVLPHGVHGPGPGARMSFTGPRAKKLARVKKPRVVTRKRKVVRLRWADVTGEHGYRVRMARGAGPWRVVRRPAADARRVRLAGLRPGSRYRFQVRAVAKDRPNGRWSRTLKVRTRR